MRKSYPELHIVGYGHIGDGNLHVNICTKNNETIDEANLFKKIAKFKGSISAEHGVGLEKGQYLYLQKSP